MEIILIAYHNKNVAHEMEFAFGINANLFAPDNKPTG